VAGTDLVLYHAPGETNDQIMVWWPKKQILFPADNIYRAFPNLYAVRGTMTRYVQNIPYSEISKYSQNTVKKS
jgi:glyoxylase-like metal-dependent hydrolase (beta-lactamase superfamily II)